MARGRKPDLSLPPTRSLEAQRRFRLRKAEAFANLEKRVRDLESENEGLRAILRSNNIILPTPSDQNPDSTPVEWQTNPDAGASNSGGSHVCSFCGHTCEPDRSSGPLDVLASAANGDLPVNGNGVGETSSAEQSIPVHGEADEGQPGTQQEQPGDLPVDPRFQNGCGNIMDCAGLMQEWEKHGGANI